MTMTTITTLILLTKIKSNAYKHASKNQKCLPTRLVATFKRVVANAYFLKLVRLLDHQAHQIQIPVGNFTKVTLFVNVDCCIDFFWKVQK